MVRTAMHFLYEYKIKCKWLNNIKKEKTTWDKSQLNVNGTVEHTTPEVWIKCAVCNSAV